jgi:hypothetical protein
MRTVRGIVKSCQIESFAQLKTARLLLPRDSDRSAECGLNPRRIRRIALEQNVATQTVQRGAAPDSISLPPGARHYLASVQASLASAK